MWATYTIYQAVFTYLADWCVCSLCYWQHHLPHLAMDPMHRLPWQDRISLVSNLPLLARSLSDRISIGYVMGGIFPLFTQAMFRALTYKWANTLFACIAVLMIPIPYVSVCFVQCYNISNTPSGDVFLRSCYSWMEQVLAKDLIVRV